MRYEGDIYRPPSEAYSLLVQATIGCTHNKCTFCKMFKNKKFRIRPLEEVIEDLDWARVSYRRVEKIFLCDADALALSNRRLLPILNHIQEKFPECERVTIYGRANNIERKTDEELKELRDAGLTMVYIGAESGSDKVLKDVNKGVTRAQLIEAVQRIEAVGIQASVTFISGLAGKDGWREHAIETGTMISEMQPSYAALLTLLVEPNVPMYEDIQSGKLQLLSPEEVMVETKLMLENVKLDKPCIFRANHASNYIPLRGTLPNDTQRLIDLIENATANHMFKDERFRAL